jgi:hypothetical protein
MGVRSKKPLIQFQICKKIVIVNFSFLIKLQKMFPYRVISYKLFGGKLDKGWFSMREIFQEPKSYDQVCLRVDEGRGSRTTGNHSN